MRTIGYRLLLVALFATFVQGCATEAPTVFPPVMRIESELKRGVSTKSDVLRVLGAPTGKGNAVFPTDPRPHEVWYYPDIEITGVWMQDAMFATRAPNWIALRHQFLFVLFEKDLFDGFMWYSNVGQEQSLYKKGRYAPPDWLMGRPYQWGWPPRTDPLGTLKVGISSVADVLLALGEPRGTGVVRFPMDRLPRQIWFYEQTRIPVKQVHITILLVFLRDERYDGHLWFSSIQSSEQEK